MILTNNNDTMIVLNSLICIILIIATISNSLLLLVFHRRPGLRTISNRFVINLLVTNLITCWILLPLLLFNNCWQKSPIVESEITDATNNNNYILQCAVFEGIAIGLCVACVLSVLMIGIDQYFAVIDPLRYHSSIKATTLLVMIVISWTVSIGFGVFGGVSVNRNCTWYVCEYLNDNPLAVLPKIYQITFSIVFVIFAFVIPFAAICWIYLSICSAAHGNYQRTKRSNGTSNNGGGGVQDTIILDYSTNNVVSTIHESVEYDLRDKKKLYELPKPIHHSSTKSSLKSTSSSIVNSLRHRISNASMFRYREETRAARISASVIVMALFCWLPFTSLLLIRSPLLSHFTIPSYVKQMGILSLCANAVVSPLIFAHRNRRIHRELCKLFRLSKRRTSYYDNNLNVCRRNSVKKRHSRSESRARDSPISTTMVVPSNENCYFTFKKALVDADNKSRKTCVSILNRVWRIAKESEHKRNSLRLPEVALETDTSRSSFSSNASSGPNQHSTSPASFNDVAKRV